MKRILIGLIGLVFVSCAGFPAQESDAYPAPELSLTQTGLHSLSASTGAVKGRLISKTHNVPLQNLIIYLGNLVPLEPGPGYLVVIDYNTSPQSPLDPAGYFVMPNVTPGTYGLVVWAPFKGQILMDTMQADKQLLVTITAGQVVDLGDIFVDWPQ